MGALVPTTLKSAPNCIKSISRRKKSFIDGNIMRSTSFITGQYVTGDIFMSDNVLPQCTNFHKSDRILFKSNIIADC